MPKKSAASLVSKLDELNDLIANLNGPAIVSLMNRLKGHEGGELLTAAEVQDIEAEGAPYNQAQKLLKLIRNKEDSAIEVLISVLRRLSRYDLANRLEGGAVHLHKSEHKFVGSTSIVREGVDTDAQVHDGSQSLSEIERSAISPRHCIDEGDDEHKLAQILVRSPSIICDGTDDVAGAEPKVKSLMEVDRSQLNVCESKATKNLKSQFIAPTSQDPYSSQPDIGEIQATMEFQRKLEEFLMSNESEISSYYFRSVNDLVIHPQKSNDAESLRTLLSDSFGTCKVNNFQFHVTDDPVFATFSCKVKAGGKEQSLGMYVKKHPSVYWVSTAHGLITTDDHQEFNCYSESKKLHDDERVKFSIPGIPIVRMPTPYVCYAVPKSGHYLNDIMVGPVPIFSNDPEWYLHPKINGNSDTEFHPTKIAEISGSFVLGNAEFANLNGCKVQSYSSRNSKAMQGTLHLIGKVKWPCSKDPSKKKLTSIFTILCSEQCEPPEVGDSGSVWARQHSDGRYEAIAITNCIATNKSCWYATPLWYSLQAIGNMYKCVFDQFSPFEGIGLFLHKPTN